MLRNALGAVAGYLVMVVLVMLGIGAAWMILGAEGAFDGDGPHPSPAWLAASCVFGFAGALAGGWVAVKVGHSLSAVKILVVLMLVLGAYMAITAESSYLRREPVDKPVAEMSFFEAGRHAKQPDWYNIFIPVIGAVGALVGGRKAV